MSTEATPAHAIDERTGEAIIEDDKYVSLANPNYAAAPFADFESVGPETDLTTLNLNWGEKDLPERRRTKHVHRLHPYLGKFIPQLVEIFIRKFEPELVCDPFAGSGTTLVEAEALGVDSFGVDVSPFNCLLTKVKTDTYDLERLEREIRDILRRSDTGREHQSRLLGHEGDNDLPESPEYVENWFAKQTQRELLSYCALIPEYQYGDVLKIILSRSARSARLVRHDELDFPKEPQRGSYECRKHGRICTPVQEARKFLRGYSKDTMRRIREFSEIRGEGKATVVCGDSREVEFPPADLIVTSPPYVGLIDYHEQHRYAYELLSLLPEPFESIGYSRSGLRDNEELEIGPASDGRSAAAREDYAAGITEAFARAVEPMPRGSRVVVVVHDKDDLYDEMVESLPVEHIVTLNRHVNRRTGRRNSAFYEQVLIWGKP